MQNQSTPTIRHFSCTIKLNGDFPEEVEAVEKMALDFINTLGLTVVDKVSHKFDPSGVTLIYILSQSHLAIHTWPEFNTIHIDMVICRELDKNQFENAIKKIFGKSNLLYTTCC